MQTSKRKQKNLRYKVNCQKKRQLIVETNQLQEQAIDANLKRIREVNVQLLNIKSMLREHNKKLSRYYKEAKYWKEQTILIQSLFKESKFLVQSEQRNKFNDCVQEINLANEFLFQGINEFTKTKEDLIAQYNLLKYSNKKEHPFYCQASKSLHRLSIIRSQWDEYLI